MNRKTIGLFFVSLLYVSTALQAETSLINPLNGQLNLQIKSPERCFIGDLDLISLELNKELEQRRHVIATIEALPGGLPIVGGGVVDLTNRPGGLSQDALLPSVSMKVEAMPEQATLAAFYICKDGDRDSSCVNNKIQDFADILKPYQVPDQAIDKDTGRIIEASFNSPEKLEDKVYYFRPVVITPEGLFFPSSENEEEYKREFINYSEIESNQVMRSTKSLGSLPLEVQDNTLVVQLPRYVIENCIKLNK